MAFSTGGFHGMNYIEEVDWGTTPATPQMIALRITGSSLGLNKDAFESQELRSDRQVSDVRTGTKKISGDFKFELSPTVFDELLEGALFGDWATNVLKAGVVKHSYTFERLFTDIDQYLSFTGCMINSLSLNLAPNAIVTGSMNIVGKSMLAATAPLDETPTAAATGKPFDAFTGVIQEGGVTIGVLTSLDLTLENNIDPAFVLGSAVAAGLTPGRIRATGRAGLFFENMDMYNKFINETDTSLSIQLSNGTNSQTWSFPKVRYTGAELPVENEGAITLTMPWQAIYDSVTGTSVQITRA